MRFMCLYRPAAGENGPPPQAEDFAKMGRFVEEMVKSGALLATDGLHPTARGARVRRADGNFTVTDGPFTETKEVIAGYALIQAKSKEEAIELTRRFLEAAGDGESEIRQVYEPTEFSCTQMPPEEVAREQKWRDELQSRSASR